MFQVKLHTMTELKQESLSIGSNTGSNYLIQRDQNRVAIERTLFLVISFFQLVDSVWIADRNTVLNTKYKVNLIIETEGNCIGLHVITSNEDASKFQEDKVDHKRWCGYPDIVVAGLQRTGWEIVDQIAELTGLCKKQRYLKAMQYAHRYKGTIQYKYSFGRWGDIVALGLAVPRSHEFQFITNPPLCN
ncbi:MAG: hypothetical protein ACK58N_04590 [Synechocystis sp.]|jgi:hypothetical protein